MTSTLLLIDGTNILRRVYEANKDQPDLEEKAQQGILNTTASLRKIVEIHQPTHALAVFDSGGKNWRHALYPLYQSERKPMDAALRNRLPAFYAALIESGLPVVSIDGVEADDVIATVAKRWLGEGRGDAIIASNDKDLHVLVETGALIWNHFASEWRDAAWIERKFDVPISVFGEYLALTGDATDGVPGVAGIGAKTASKLLRTYGSLEAIMAGAGILKNPLGEKLRNGKEALALSQKLVALKSDVVVGVSWKDLLYQPPSGHR
jgi:DNA polymerase-1